MNDTILLVDDYSRRLALLPGLDKARAIADSAAHRFRLILMTTLSTAFGLLPLIYETSLQATFLIPRAISLGFGILIATPFLLLAVPATVLILKNLAPPLRCANDAAGEYLPRRNSSRLRQRLKAQPSCGQGWPAAPQMWRSRIWAFRS